MSETYDEILDTDAVTNTGAVTLDVDEAVVVVPAQAGAGGPNIQAMVNRANEYRKDALERAIGLLVFIHNMIAQGVKPEKIEKRKLDTIFSWLNVKPGDAEFLLALETAINRMKENQALSLPINFPPASVPTCATEDKNASMTAFAWSGKSIGINMCVPWVKASFQCQRVVMIHEHFHMIGLNEGDPHSKFPKDVKSGDTPTRTTADALNDPAYLAGLTSELFSGHQDSCP